MNWIKSALLIGIICLFSQGCASTTLPETQAGKASLANLGNGVCRQNNGLLWQVERSEIFQSRREARDYAANLDLGGYSDWRLPSQDEYYSLCYIFELRRSGDCPIELKGNYWLSDDDEQAGRFESFPLCGGSSFRYLKSNSGRVRAVRP